MLVRKENVNASLEGLCAGCKTRQPIAFREAWHLRKLYKIGVCPSCKYENHVFLKAA